jgi:hypothetical protein
MGTTPDRFPGPIEEEEVRLLADAGDPSVSGGLKYDGSSFRFRDSIGSFNPRMGGFDPATLVITSEGSLIYDSNGELTLKAGS